MKTVFSEKEINLLSELRKSVGELLEDEYEKTDDFLITWIRYGNSDVRSILNGTPDGKDRYVRYHWKHLEYIMKIVKRQYFQTDGQVTNFNFMFDMDGFSYGQLVSPRVISALTEVAKTGEDNFPGTINAMYMLNVPKAFKALFNIVKPFLSGDTISRIKLFDSNKVKWREALLQDIPEDQLSTLFPITENSI